MLNFFDGESAKIKSVIFYLVSHMKGFGHWRESSADFLDGPSLFAAGGLPEQLRCFSGANFGYQCLFEGVLKVSALLGLAGRVAGLPWFPFRSWIAGNAWSKFGITYHLVDSKRLRWDGLRR
ncbi:MAG TPA: hypothetical protein VJK29_12025 [Terriglobales bacterium]|nr:hypothetical protein [Terriglobales bacterium]